MRFLKRRALGAMLATGLLLAMLPALSAGAAGHTEGRRPSPARRARKSRSHWTKRLGDVLEELLDF